MRRLIIDRNRLVRNVSQALNSLVVADSSSPIGRSYRLVCDPEAPENRLLTQAALNNMWQSWNSFCRSFWIAYLVGGQSSKGRRMIGKAGNPNCPTECLLSDWLRSNAGYSRSCRKGPLQYYQEPTWGDPDKLDAALTNADSTDETINMQRALILFGDDLKDLQRTRNAAVHPSKGSVISLKAEVGSRYSIRINANGGLPYAMALTYSVQISTRAIAIERWSKSLTSIASSI